MLNIYAYQRLVGKIDDAADLRNQFILLFDLKDKKQMAEFGLKYANHIIEITGFVPNEELLSAFDAVREWMDGKANYHKARNIDFKELKQEAKEQNDIIKKKFIKTMSQLVCIPHVKAHGLWGADMAITLINSMYPNNLDRVIEERKVQITMLQNII